MKPALDSSDRQFLDSLHRMGPVTVHDICKAMRVTATAVRQRLLRLQAKQLLRRQPIKGQRGRPHYTYAVTERGVRELGDNYADLALILWQEVNRIPDQGVRTALVERVREALVDRFGRFVGAADLRERMEQLCDVLVGHGFDIEVDRSGPLPVLRENNCPYHELASADTSICRLEHSVFERMLDVNIEMTACCLDGHSCCEFQVSRTD